jgi:acid phosphatase type 7
MNKNVAALIGSLVLVFSGLVYTSVAEASTRACAAKFCVLLPLVVRNPGSTPVPTKPSSPTATPSFRPSPTPTASFSAATVVIGAAGDIVCGTKSHGGACKQMETSDLLLAMNPDRVLVLGDVQYESGALSDFQNFYHPSWGRVKSKTSPVVGNHEYGTSNASGYFTYFGAAAGDPTKGYYSYNLGGWHIVALNSSCSRVGGCGDDDPQYEWLQADLRANTALCTLAYMHHPLWTSSDLSTSSVQPFVELLYDYGVELLLAGHAHYYERFARQDADGNSDPVYGLREFVVGTGGRNFTSFETILPNSEVRSRTFGVLKLTLAPTQYTWQFVPIAGSTWSDGPLTELCHGPHW